METGLLLRTEKSVLFIIPWGPHWIIGDTDTAWELDRAHPAATGADIDYVLEKASSVLLRPLGRATWRASSSACVRSWDRARAPTRRGSAAPTRSSRPCRG